jgi:hypothetical protein
MKAGNLCVCAVFSLTVLAPAYAADSITIAGEQIPLIEGAAPAQAAGTPRVGGATVAAYTTSKSLSEVITFYESFLHHTGFLVIGGQEAGAFNVSVKKGDAQFSVRIYSAGGNTVIQFIW